MNDLIVRFFELFGLYSNDFTEFMKGLGETCEYDRMPLFAIIAYIAAFSIVVCYLLHYRFINSPTFNGKGSWWVMAIFLALFNFTLAIAWPFSIYRRGNYCEDLDSLSVTFSTDVFGYGLLVAVLVFLAYAFITSLSVVRNMAGHNMHNTTFWKP